MVFNRAQFSGLFQFCFIPKCLAPVLTKLSYTVLLIRMQIALYYSLRVIPATLEINKVVQDDLKWVTQWMEINKLILNQSKTKSILFGSRQNLAKSPFFLYSAERS